MALTNANVLDLPYRVVGSQREVVYDCTFDSKYLTGGESLTPADLGLNYFERVVCSIQKIGGTVNVANASYDKAAKTLQLFDETPAEVASEADVSTIVVRVEARGS